jgi:hypothetical protein
LSCASRVSKARAARHVLNHFQQFVRPRRGMGHLRRALPASYQHPLPGLAMLGVVAAVLAVLVGVRWMMR